MAKPLGIDAKKIETAFWNREHLQNTAIGQGVAIPHATLPEARRTYVGLFSFAKPIPYGAPNNGTIQLCVVTIGPPSDRQVHLLVLSTVAKLISGTSFLADIA